VLDPGEQCDDGNAVNGDGCDAQCRVEACFTCAGQLSVCTPAVGQGCTDDGNPCTSDVCDATATCTHPPKTDGTNCSDGLFCNGAETCQGGVCQSGAAPCPLLCDEANQRCVTGCLSAPQTCRTAQRSRLLVKNEGNVTKDKLLWKWTRGAPTSQAEFADPTSTADYALCIFAGTTSALIGQSVVPASASMWSVLSTKGYRYTDPTATADGIAKVLLKGSTRNKSSVRVRGKGSALPVLPLPLTAPVTVQLVNGDSGLCWGASFSDSQLRKNDAGELKARAP
jgi:cysteine-rich repeat protein